MHLLFLQTLLIFLFPIAVYCWILGMINRRSHPLMVSGRRDFVGLLFAASGFLLVVGPAILTGVYDRLTHELPLLQRPRLLATIGMELLAHQWGIWLGYYVLMIAGALALLWWRGRKTVIYNVNPVVFDTVLAGTLDRLGSAWARQGNRLRLRSTASAVTQKEVLTPARGVSEGPAGAAPSDSDSLGPQRSATESVEHNAVLVVEPFAVMCHVTLHWRSASPALREEVETELARALGTVETEENPAGTWLLGVATCLFGLMFVTVLVIILGATLATRRW